MDILVNPGAVAYGVPLVVATFARHPLTEAMRIDALFIPQANERTRPLNLLMGVAIAGYGAWSLLSR
mgnify:CR=1 FL=1